MRKTHRCRSTTRGSTARRGWANARHLGLGAALIAAGPAAISAQTEPPRRATRIVGEITEAHGGGRYFLTDIGDIRSSPTGTLFVLAGRESHVLELDTLGRLVRTIGRRGSGPGELAGPALSMQLQDSLLLISDLMARRLVVFRTDGRHVRTVSTTRSGVEGSTLPVQAMPVRGGQIEVTSAGSVNFREDLHSRVLFRHADGLDTLAVIPAGVFTFTVQWSTRAQPSWAGTGFGNGGAWALHADTLLAHADGYTGEIRWLALRAGGARVVNTATLPGRPAPIARAELDPVLSRLQAGYRKHDRSARLVFKSAPATRSLATQALFDSAGNLWVGAAPRGKTVRWTVFSPRAQLLYTVVLPTTFELRDVRGNRLYGRALDDDDVPIIRVLELTR